MSGASRAEPGPEELPEELPTEPPAELNAPSVPVLPQTDPVASSNSSTRDPVLAVGMMVVATLMWSSAGIVIRMMDHAPPFELTFWRSVFGMLFMLAWLRWSHGAQWLSAVRASGRAGLISGLMWAVMFCCFMVAVAMTTVAKALVVMSISPLLAALLSRLLLHEQIAPRTWVAIGVAAVGIVWMVADGLSDPRGTNPQIGMVVAFGVPLAAALNLIALKWDQNRRSAQNAAPSDLVPALLIGSIVSVVLMAPFAFPMQVSQKDLAWLAFLGVFQLAVPCIVMVRATQHLRPQQTSLLALLEVVFGPVWVWIGVGEAPASATVVGGSMILGALAANELLGLGQGGRRRGASRRSDGRGGRPHA